jgi:TolB-like protein
MLVETPLRTRTREEIQQRLWSTNTFVDFERGTNKVVHSLREALGETASNPHFIETVATEGYRFFSQLVEQSRPPLATDRVDRLAVLPLETEPQLASLGKGITMCLIEKLARMPGLRVMAESTVKSHSLKGLGPQQAGQVLGVRAVLSGELTQQSAELQLRMELIDSMDGALLCGSHITRAAQPAMHREGELAQEIVNQFRSRLTVSPSLF